MMSEVEVPFAKYSNVVKKMKHPKMENIAKCVEQRDYIRLVEVMAFY